MAPDERVAYVIADYSTPALAAAAQASILSFRPDSEVVVARADGRDGRTELGYSAALNLGIARLEGSPEVVCCCNADVEMLESDDALFALFDRNSRMAVVGPRQIDAEDRIVHGGIVPFEDGTPWDLDLRHRCWLWAFERGGEADELTRGSFAVPTVAGSVLYARRRFLEEAGGWPERFRFYYEDTALGYLARHRGWHVAYTGSVTWRHLWQGSPVSEAFRTERMEESRAEFVRFCAEEGIPLRDPLGEAVAP